MSLSDLNTGALAPVADEVSLGTFDVSGEIPADLNGTLLRNGPNPLSGRFEGEGVLNWWPEAAMLHAIRFDAGTATGYRNRWARTQAWAQAAGAEPQDYPATNPNVNVVQHGGALMALAEGGLPVCIDTALEPIATAHPAATQPLTAHPKVDPATGELVAFRQDWAPPFLSYRVFDADGAQTHASEIDMGSPAMMHDMAITASWSLFFDLGVSLDLALLEKGFRMPLRWHEERVCRIGLVPRHGGEARWIEIEPCFIQHVVNAYDAPDGSVVLDVARYPHYFVLDADTGGFAPNPLATLWRYRIDPQAGRAQAEEIRPEHMELPRINERCTGRAYRYTYSVEQPTDAEMRGLLKFDLHTGSVQRHALAPGDQNSEPVFVPRDGADDEDDGWLLACVYRAATRTTDVVVLDAQDISASPRAVVHLPRRIPAGFHGAWVPHA